MMSLSLWWQVCVRTLPDAPIIQQLARLRGLQVALGLERGHAARRGRGHGLTVDMILGVACGEDARHRGLGRARDDLYVLVRQELDLAAEDLRVRLMPDRDEEAVDRTLVERARLEVLHAHARDLALADVRDTVDGAVPDELDLGVLEGALLHDLGGAQAVASMDHVDLPPEPREEERFLHGGVAAAHDHDVLVLEEEAVARGAGRHAPPHELGLRIAPEKLRA